MNLRAELVVSLSSDTELDEMQRQQLRVAGTRLDGEELSAEARLDPASEEACLADLCDVFRVFDDGRHVYDVWQIEIGDSGTVFAAGTTDVVAEILEGEPRCEATLSAALRDALANPSPSAAAGPARTKPRTRKNKKRGGPNTIVGRYRRILKKLGRRPAMIFQTETGRGTVSFATLFEAANEAARAFIALGMDVDESAVMVGLDDPRWLTFDQGFAFAAGELPVEARASDLAYAVNRVIHHEAAFVLTETLEQWTQMTAAADLPTVRHVITLQAAPATHDPRVLDWEAFLARSKETSKAELDARFEQLEDVDAAGDRSPARPGAGDRTELMRELERAR